MAIFSEEYLEKVNNDIQAFVSSSSYTVSDKKDAINFVSKELYTGLIKGDCCKSLSEFEVKKPEKNNDEIIKQVPEKKIKPEVHETTLTKVVVEKAQRTKKSSGIGNLMIVLIMILAIAGISLYLYKDYMSKHTKFPYSYSKAMDKKYEELLDDLEDEGFSDISLVEVFDGWKESGTVLYLDIDGSDSYNEEKYYDKEIDIIIYYSSEGRTDASGIFNNWGNSNYSELEQRIERAGYSNIFFEEIENQDPSKGNMVASIVINNEEYDNGPCFITKDAGIIIKYYSSTIELSLGYDDCIEHNYSDIVDDLTDDGFTNITLYRLDDLITGWITEEGAISEITINGSIDFEAGEKYNIDSSIVIVVHTFYNSGCEDITEIYE